MNFDEIKASIILSLDYRIFELIEQKTGFRYFWIGVKSSIVGNVLCHYEIVATTDRINIINEKNNFNEQEHFINLEIHFEDYYNHYPIVLGKIQQQKLFLNKKIIERKIPIRNTYDKQIGIIYSSYSANSPTLVSDLRRDLDKMNKKFKKEYPKFIKKCMY